MALSKPQLGIQSPIQCQLCEKDPKISWKCLECDLLMCTTCKNNIHPKFKLAGEHRIMNIKDIRSTSPPNKDHSKIDITVVEEYQTKLKEVVHLGISLDDTLWIGEGFQKKGIRLFTSHTGLQKVKCEGKKLKVISSFNSNICGMAISPGNDLLIATGEGPIFKQIKSGTHKIVDTVYKVDPYHPLSIYVTRKNKVIVGACNKIETDQFKGVVIVMDQDGIHEKMYGEDQTQDMSFTFPWKITATNNDNIFVIDTFGDKDEGSVIVLGQEDIINTYSGNPAINSEDKPFAPCHFTTTPADNVIVVDTDNCVLHILNSTGHLITYISTKDKGIADNPRSIGLAMAGQFCMLYIGTTTDDDSKDKGKLYKLHMVDC